MPGLYLSLEYQEQVAKARYGHFMVYTTRLVTREFHVDEQDTTLEVLGVIVTLLCYIPVAVNLAGERDFRQLCRSARSVVMGDEDQWCIAILKEGSTLTEGPCTLVGTTLRSCPTCKEEWQASMLQPVSFRPVQTSLWEECVRMGIAVPERQKVFLLGEIGTVEADSEFGKDYVLVQEVCDTFMVWYQDGKLMQRDGYMCLNGQGVRVNRYLTCKNHDMLRMRNDFSSLFYKSFESHACINLDSRVPHNSSSS